MLTERLLRPDQLVTAERYQLGLDRVAEAVERLNDLGRDLGMQPLAIRCCGSKLLHGENAAGVQLNEILQGHYLASIRRMMEPERLAA